MDDPNAIAAGGSPPPNIPPPPSGSAVLANIPPPPSGTATMAHMPPPPSGTAVTQPALDENGDPLQPADWTSQHPHPAHIKNFHQLLSAIDDSPTWMHFVPGFATSQEGTGGTGEVAKTLQFGIDMGRKLLGLPPRPPSAAANDVIGQLAAHKPTNVQQNVGAAEENLGEFFSGEELLGLLGKAGRALPLAERMKQATGLAQVLKQYPLLAKLVNIGIGAAKQGTVAGAQTLAKTGGDVNAATRSAVGTGILSAGIGAVTAPIASTLRGKIPGMADIGGQEFETAPPTEQPKPTKNQAAGQAVVRGAAKDTAAGHLQELNESRAPEPRQGAETEYFKSGDTWAERPRWGGKANFEPVDVQKTVDKVGSYTDAARTLKGKAIEGFNQISDALAHSGEAPESFSQVRQAYQDAEAKFMEGKPEAEGELESAYGQLQQLAKKIPKAINLKELSGINDAYRNAISLEKFSRAVDSTFTGAATSDATRAGEYYGFNGQQLRKNLDEFIRSQGRGRADRLVGRENLDNMLRVADLNTTNAGRAKFGAAIRAVRENLIRMHVGPIAAGGYVGRMAGLPWEVGAGAGWAAAEGLHRLTNLIVAKPALAKNVIFALDAGAKPENYGPFIAQMIRKMVEQQPQEEDNNDGQTR